MSEDLRDKALEAYKRKVRRAERRADAEARECPDE